LERSLSNISDMKIGIIGSGMVAQVLASGFAANGHSVRLGTRDTPKLNEWLASAGDSVSAGSFAEAADFGEIIIMSVNAVNIASAIEIAGRERFAQKIVIDLTNPMDFSNGLPPRFTVNFGNSLGEQMQAALPDAFVVKAFNSMGASVMTAPMFDGEAATHFIAGNDEQAKLTVKTLIEEFGWEVLDAGGIDQAFFLEALASLWVNYSIKAGHREQAFRLLTR